MTTHSTHVMCSTCGQRRHPRMQAGPREAEPQMSLVRLLNLFLAALILWLAVIGWGLSEAHKAGLL